MKILAISGSLQRGSSNRALLEAAVGLATAGMEIVIFDGLRALGHFDPDLEVNEPLPAVQEWRSAISRSDALLIASPEYGFSLPGVLKNGIDWVIGTGELERKVIAVTASVNHRDRGRRGLRALRDTLAAVSAQIVGGEPIVRGPTFEADIKSLLEDIVKRVQSSAA